MAEEIAWLSAVDLLARFRARTLSPVDVTESLLGPIERVQPALNAFQFVDATRRAAARASGARWRAGAPVGGLDGVPVTIKENVLMKGFPTRNGSRTVRARRGTRTRPAWPGCAKRAR
jgi:aspartyl-tRNA(Asn)/glutamyl-tRNA(Gln) amidotransferase subunit A